MPEINAACIQAKQALLADWGGGELIIRFQSGSIPLGRIKFR